MDASFLCCDYGLRQLVQQAIGLWYQPYYSRSRIAIAISEDCYKYIGRAIFIRLEARLRSNIGNALSRVWSLDGVHAFAYNSTESEPIWMKFGTLLLSAAGPGRL